MELRDIYKLALDSIRQQQVNLSRVETEIQVKLRELDEPNINIHKPRKKRELSPEARKRIGMAQKKRWAAHRAAQKKGGRGRA